MPHLPQRRNHHRSPPPLCALLLRGAAILVCPAWAGADDLPELAQQAYVKASNTGLDYFGSAIAMSGNTLVVGAWREGSSATGIDGDQLDDTAENSGAVYVYVRELDTWIQQAYIKASNTEAGDQFGWAVDIDGDTLVVSAPSEASGSTGVNGDQDDNSLFSAGAAYVFVRNGETWSQQAYLKASNPDEFDSFGRSVAVSGNTIVVGAWDEDSVTGPDDNSNSNAGAAYVFKRSNGNWSQQAFLKASNARRLTQFGNAVDIDGDTIAVAALGESSNATGVNGDENNTQAQGAGAVYVFKRSGSAWTQQAYIKASNTDASDYFGWAVAVSGDTLAASARGEASNATGVNGDQDDDSAGTAGAVYVFTRSSGHWSQQAYIKASNTEANDAFGEALALFGDALAVGAPREAGNATGVDGDQDDNSLGLAGAVYVFTRTGSTWSQLHYLKASNTGLLDQFGNKVAITADSVAVGALNESSNATGIDGEQSNNSYQAAGAAYVFYGQLAGGAFVINAGVNDAWYSLGTPGQGVLITVFPVLGKIFIAIFTYDTVRPANGVMANVGGPGQRWVTALGDYAGNEAVLEAELTTGGLFDSVQPAPMQTGGYGTITLTFIDCNHVIMNYDFPSIGVQGEVQLTRVAPDNVTLCEGL